MVFNAGTRHIGISRRIESEEERSGLEKSAQSLGTNEGIHFTHCLRGEEQARNSKRSEFPQPGCGGEFNKGRRSVDGPSLIHQDLDLIACLDRDSSAPTRNGCHRFAQRSSALVDFVRQFIAASGNESRALHGKEPLFEQQGIEEKLLRHWTAGVARSAALSS